MTEEGTRLRIVASTDPADLPPEPTELRGQLRLTKNKPACSPNPLR